MHNKYYNDSKNRRKLKHECQGENIKCFKCIQKGKKVTE